MTSTHIAAPRNRFSGVIAAVPTPVGPDGAPDTSRFLKHAAWALDNGCDGLNVLGTTGEATSVPVAARKEVMKAAAGGLDRARLMVGTGTPDLATTIDLTRFAYDQGFAAALVLPPFYYKGLSDDALYAWFSALIAATADQPIPLYLYNFPQMTGLVYSPALARRLVEAFPDRIHGAKDSSGDLSYAAELARIDGFAVFPSSETALAHADRDGYAGCISATVNVAPRLSAALWADRGNPALAAEAGRVRSTVSAQPLIPAVKHIVGRIHGDDGYARVLPPQLPLTDGQKSALAALAEELRG